LEKYWVATELQDSVKQETFVADVPMYLPHELVGACFGYGWDFFSRIFFGGIGEAEVPDLLRHHWDHVKGAEWYARHPCNTTHKDMRGSLAPIRCHGDDASVKSMTGRKVLISSIHSEWASDDPLSSRLLSFVLLSEQIIAGSTLLTLMAVWAWSFAALLSGVYPSVDHKGQPFPPESKRRRKAGSLICGGWLWAFGGALADWSYHARLFYPHLHGSSHKYLCFRCLGSRAIDHLRFWERSSGCWLVVDVDFNGIVSSCNTGGREKRTV